MSFWIKVEFSFERDSSDMSTQLQVSATFAGDLGAGSLMYVCSWYSRVLQIDTSAGQVREVLTRVA